MAPLATISGCHVGQVRHMHPRHVPTTCTHDRYPRYVPTTCSHDMHPRHAPTICTHDMCPRHVPTTCAHDMCPRHVPTLHAHTHTRIHARTLTHARPQEVGVVLSTCTVAHRDRSVVPRPPRIAENCYVRVLGPLIRVVNLCAQTYSSWAQTALQVSSTYSSHYGRGFVRRKCRERRVHEESL